MQAGQTLNICHKQLATKSVGMKSIRPEKSGTIPKLIETVNEVGFDCSAGRLQPSVETENTAKAGNYLGLSKVATVKDP